MCPPNFARPWFRTWCCSRSSKIPFATASERNQVRDGFRLPPKNTEKHWCCASPITAKDCATRLQTKKPAGIPSRARDWRLRAAVSNRSMGRISLWFFETCKRAAPRPASHCRSEDSETLAYRKQEKGRMPNFRVLIVDDEPISRRRLRRLLALEPECELAGECENGLEAVRLLARETIDILFLDVQMPEMDGFEVVHAISRAHPLIIFTSAYDEYALKAFEVHAFDYLLKPFDRRRFRESVQRARSHLTQTKSGMA